MARVPASTASEDVLTVLRGISGAEHVSVDDELRIVHWAGKSVLELMQTLRNDFARVPDAVVYPGSEDEVTAILTAAVENLGEAGDIVVVKDGYGRNYLLISGDVGWVPGPVFATFEEGLAEMAAACTDLWQRGFEGERLVFARA